MFFLAGLSMKEIKTVECGLLQWQLAEHDWRLHKVENIRITHFID